MTNINIFDDDAKRIDEICEDKGYSVQGLIEELLYLAEEHYDEL